MITKLTSNYSDNSILGVGKVELHKDVIRIVAEPGTEAVLLRGINKVVLLKANDIRQTIHGKALVNDVYILEKGDQKLTVKAEAAGIDHGKNLFVNSNPLYDATSQKRKTTLSVGILVLFLLVISAIFGINQKKNKEFRLESEKILQAAIENFEKSLNEADLDKERSRKYFIEARDASLKLKNSGYKSDQLTKLIDDISSKEAFVLGEKIVDLKEFLDLTLQISAFNGESMVSSGEEMFIVDEVGKNIIQVDLSTKRAKIVAAKDNLEGLVKIASYEDKLFGLTGDGLYQINNEKIKVLEKDWEDPLFYLYSANIYLLDKTANQIYRYSGTLQGKSLTFSNKQEWLAPGVEVDFSKIKDIVIDGSIWLLSSSGKVTKFTNGNPIAISMKGIVDNLVNPTSIYTNEQLKNVYILEKEKKRIVVLEKNGNFKMQYVSEGLKEARDLVVSEKAGKAIILTGPKLTYIEL